MTLNPTIKNQKLWVRNHLNNGVCPNIKNNYFNFVSSDRDQACYEALCWLDEKNIKTLEEAWDKCTNPSWLLWMLHYMKPTQKEFLKINYVLKDKLSKGPNKKYMFRYLYEESYTFYEWSLDFYDLGKNNIMSLSQLRRYARLIKETVGNPWVKK